MQYDHVSISYGERTVLRDIQVTIDPGEFVFLIGASGSGKTSFIRSLIGAKKLKKWKILDDKNRDIALLSPKELLSYRRWLGTIFQDFKLLPKKTVRENVAFAMEVCGYDSATISQKVPQVLAQVWLLSKSHTYIEELSGGEIQRTCIARALIHDPDMIIADEPTGNLDRANATEIMHLLEWLHQSGKTIIMATHDELIVDTMRKRVIAFADGRIVSDEIGGKYCL
jgi:cell division transport system ATP-binding protein